MSRHVSLRLTTNASLLPLAVCCTALWAYLSMAPLATSGLGWKLALEGLFEYLSQGVADAVAIHLLMALPLGFLWQGVFWQRGNIGRFVTGLCLLAGLIICVLLVDVGRMYFKSALVPAGGLLGTVAGLVIGMSLWWVMGKQLMMRWPRLPGAIWPGLVLMVLLLWALPMVPDRPLGDPVMAGGAAIIADLPQRFYQLIKSAILWVPVAFIFALAGRGADIPRWGLALILAPVLVGLPVLSDLSWRDILELAAALPGLWVGAWLGRRTFQGDAGLKPVQATSPSRGGGRESTMVLPSTLMPAPISGEEGQARSSRRTSSRFNAASVMESSITEPPHTSCRKPKLSPLGIALGLGLLILALIGLIDFPRWQAILAIVLVLYAGALWFQPLAWLVVVPAALPLLDLAPWTGRFFLDEFDLLMLVTAGVLFLRGRQGRLARMPRLAGPLMALFLLFSLAGMLIGVLPPAPLDANAFSSYWSSYNGLRLAKGILWGGLIFLWMRNLQDERETLSRLLSLGMGLGLLGVGLVGAWEHGLYVGFEGGHETYRIFSIFSSMHTGGGHIEAYLVAALPFLWLATPKFRSLALTGPVMALTAYVMVYTVARAGVLAMAVVLAILLVASVRLALRTRGQRFVAPVAMLTVVGLVLAAGAGSGYLQKRFASTGLDWQTRTGHWSQAIDMMDDSFQARLFGMGLGSFPRIYQERGPRDNQPASFGFASEQGNTHFRLGSGATVYYAQRVPFRAGRNYRLELDVRGRQGESSIETPVCEKQLLNSRQCEWFGFAVPGDGQWHRVSKTFSSTKVGALDWFERPPVELFLYNPGKGGIVDVDNIRLLDSSGRDVLCNGDFSGGGDCWFFKTHSHLPWHIKNVWVHVLFEQGWVGLMLFAALTMLAVYRLIKAGWQGHRLAWAWLASLAGLLTVGMFDSLLDAPRIGMLLVALLLLGAGWRWSDRRPDRRSASSGKARSTGRQQDQGQHGPEDGNGLGQADDVQDADAGPPLEIRQP